jgi:lipopolysaccharide export system protein LptA
MQLIRHAGSSAAAAVAAFVLAAAAGATTAVGAAEPLPQPDPNGSRSGFLGDFSLGSSKEPIRITADMLEFDYKRRVVVYRGGVEVVQGDLTLRSTTLTVHFDERAADRDKLKQIIAEGEVRIGKGARVATGGRAVFDQTANTVTLSEDAVLHDGENRVAGAQVVVYLDEGRSVVRGGEQRVHAVLVPRDNEAGGGYGGQGDGGERPR